VLQQIAVVAYWFSLALLAGATVLYAYHFTTKRQAMAQLATAFTGAGFVTLTASIGFRSSATEGTQLTGANSLVLMAWALVFVYFVFEHLVKIKIYGTVLVPVALALLVTAQLRGVTSGVVNALPPEQAALLASWRVGIHVALIVFGSAGFIIAGVASIAYLVLETQLKSHRTSKLFKRLPSLAQTDRAARGSVQWAYPAYTAALLLGIIRAIETDVSAWWADIVVMLAGLVWGVFGVYLFLRHAKGWGGKSAAYLAILGTVLVIVLRIVSQVVGGAGRFHVFGL
jgi:ABC-type transport system involved in cytochrome c biogenesis permease subunit